MKRLEKTAVLIALADELSVRGSWCGETHMQKAVYFLQELTSVPLGFDFILYKHGPFSFDLRDELTAMRADGLLELQVTPGPYGPSLSSTKYGEAISGRFADVVRNYRAKINYVAQQLGDKGVADLERLATALFICKEDSANQLGVHGCAVKITEIKPHINSEAAERAAEDVLEMFNNIGELSA